MSKNNVEDFDDYMQKVINTEAFFRMLEDTKLNIKTNKKEMFLEFDRKTNDMRMILSGVA